MFTEEDFHRMWQPLRDRLTATHLLLNNKIRSEGLSVDVRREVAKLLYEQGYLETELVLVIYSPMKPMEFYESKLNAIALQITAQEEACLQL